MFNLVEGITQYALLEEDGPYEGDVVCYLDEEEFYEASRLGHRTMSVSFHQ